MRAQPTSRFAIGDLVRIVSTPYKDCPFVWTDGMTQYCGKPARIVGAYWHVTYKAHYYYIDVDNELHMWCENCFEPIDEEKEIAESSYDIDVLLMDMV